MQNSHVLRDCRLEVFGKVGLVLMESIWIVYMLIFDVNFNIVTIECKMLFTCVTRGTGGSSSSSDAAAVSTSALASSLCFLRSFFQFCAIVIFVTVTVDKFRFQSQKRLSQINIVVTIRLKFKVYEIFIDNEWSCKINFLFVGQHDNVNYWDLPYKISRNCKLWDGTVVVMASSVHIASWRNCTFYDQESLQDTIIDDSLQSLSNVHPAFWWVAYL